MSRKNYFPSLQEVQEVLTQSARLSLTNVKPGCSVRQLDTGETFTLKSGGIPGNLQDWIKVGKLPKLIPHVLEVAIDGKPFTSIQAALDAAEAGDLIIVWPGLYDLGNGQLILKGGVNFEFKQGVTITSTHPFATISSPEIEDPIRSNWTGEPLIINSNGLNHRILFYYWDHVITGFYWELLADIRQSQNDVLLNIYKNTLGGIPAVSRQDVGNFTITLHNAFPESCTKSSPETPMYRLNNPVSYSQFYLNAGGDYFSIDRSDDDTEIPHDGYSFLLNIKVFPRYEW